MTDKTEMLNKYQNNILRTKIVLPAVKNEVKKGSPVAIKQR